jgi:hypothetical protein
MQAKSKKWNLDRDIKFNHTVTGIVWTEEKSQWKVTVLPAGGLEFVDWADVVISARGFLHDWKWPAITNLLSFKGKMIHSAAWDHDFDFSNKRIAVIGNGSSGVQILPELAKIEATTITNFIQGPAWIFAGLPPAALVGGNDPSYNPAYSEAEIEKFRQYPEEFLRYRKKIQNSYSRLFHMVKGGIAQIRSLLMSLLVQERFYSSENDHSHGKGIHDGQAQSSSRSMRTTHSRLGSRLPTHYSRRAFS